LQFKINPLYLQHQTADIMENYIVTNDHYTLTKSVITGKINGFVQNHRKADYPYSETKVFTSKAEAQKEADFYNNCEMALSNLCFLNVVEFN